MTQSLAFESLYASAECILWLLPSQSANIDELLTAKADSSVSIGHLYSLSAMMESSYLVDPASSHMLVSKIKPCMSKYKQICTVKLRMAH